MSTTFHAGGSLGYARTGNATWSAFEEAVAALEGARHCLSFSSGMAAVTAALSLAPVGGVVVVPHVVYNGVRSITAEWAALGRAVVREVPTGDIAALEEAAQGAHVIWVETPANPTLTMTDLVAVAEIARKNGAISVCDSTLASPVGQHPLAHGIDVVMHSATKYIAGHSDVLLGTLATDDDRLAELLLAQRTIGGGIAGPFEAWLALRGLRTLPLRWERATRTAAILAERLVALPSIERVRALSLPEDPGHGLALAQLPTFSAVIAIEVAGGADAAQAVCDAVRLWTPATSLGGVESLIERRRRWGTESPGVPENLLRLSVGIEDPEDLWEDLSAAITSATTG